MRTILYVDGFNLYHGCLKNSKGCKWLNLQTLFSNILEDHHKICKICYFASKLRPLAHDPKVHLRQKTYFMALKTLPTVEIYEGYFKKSVVSMPMADPPHDFIDVIKFEEKRTDVNFAVHLLNDAYQNQFDSAIIVTSDNDMAEAMKLVRKNFPKKKLGLIPTGENPTAGLMRYAHFKVMIEKDDLKAAQFPNPVIRPSDKYKIFKPRSW